ncbi:carbohydrate ABC transporter substrate-binding protein [Candidatus Nomurabacteria bacterium]|nr:carbohydrate ABC transporter substrate-binding protein [Candidatus Kaiserbacteria bacterium]MCB9815302.1 carbohydrate ABC transporter substrate-binding protein [Candidatus Nomurabacteria bacterium]
MKLRPFELALVIIFVGLGLTALVILSTFDGGSGSDEPQAVVGSVTIWGTLPADPINKIIRELSEIDESYNNVSYRYYSPTQFDERLVNALADGTGPDLVLVSHEKLVETRKRIQPISFEFFPLRNIKDAYIDGAQIFALNDGLYGYPIAVDPLMMYWNKNIFTNSGFLSAPATWEDLVNSIFPELIKRDSDRTIRQAVVAMGEYNNVRNAFGIISALLFQGGSQAVLLDGSDKYQVKLRLSENGSSDPLRAAADFYTRFSRPSNSLYSWNRSFKDDRSEFVAERLTTYFGYGSEGAQIEKLNPNLNFDIAEVPQGAEATIRRTYGKFYAISLLKSSDNKVGAGSVMTNFAGATIANRIAVESNMVPAYRSTVALGSNNLYGRVAYKSASIALGWLNPELSASNQILATMTQDINENRRDLDGAVSDAASRLGNEY